ncbi:MAG: hypothetical protein OXN16_05190 [Gammaproteobacteria bacterium]|nr:hypothetical protein [Gammaproteobacteria bacterium]
MDNPILLVLIILVLASALSAIFWNAAHGTRMKPEREDRRSARRHRQITSHYGKEQSGLGE